LLILNKLYTWAQNGPKKNQESGVQNEAWKSSESNRDEGFTCAWMESLDLQGPLAKRDKIHKGKGRQQVLLFFDITSTPHL